MKRRNRLLSALLSCLLLFSLFSTTALATEDEESPDDSQSETPAVVSSLAELQAAIAAAKDGDTIALSSGINIIENCIVGDTEKQITVVPLDETINTYFSIYGDNVNSIVFQNIILDGMNYPCSAAIDVNKYNTGEIKTNLSLLNVTVKNVSSNWVPISLFATAAKIENCHFENNQGKRAGAIWISGASSIDVRKSAFWYNKSTGCGGAITCQGELEISDCTIKGNEAAYEETMSYTGGGIQITGTANITGCTITANVATLGGGVAVDGDTNIIDTAIYGNIGKNGADDIQITTNTVFSMSYTESMDSVYTENQPVGFYKDYMGNRFDASTNAVFIGEVIECEIDSPDFGAKFVFASDLPPKPEQPEIPEETPPVPTRPSHSGHHHSTPNMTPKKDETLKLCAGSAELDPDKPFVLAGYGDGQLHENDPITRVQFAVLLYRFLTDDSKAALESSTSVFTDIAKDSWYHDAVSAFASVGVLNGCFIFMADLVRAAQLKSEVEFIGLSSYKNATKSSGVVQITRDLQRDISGRNIIIVEDILDSGNTLAFLKNYLMTKGAASITIATLLDKPARREKPIKADYVGFVVPDEFVVGYGLDYCQQYRNMPYIGVLKPEVYTK